MAQTLKYIPKLFADKSLTKKAFLNALASALDYSANIIVAFVVTPFMVTGLGDYYYGAWQIMMRLVGYISPASGRPTQALKFTLAKEQNSNDYELKRSYVGSTLEVLALFLPLMAALGGVLTWFFPYWIKTPDQYVWNVRVACALLVLNLIGATLVAVPHSVLEGENKAYKRMGLSTFLVLVGGGLTWLALYFKTGILGVAGAALLSTVIQLLFFLQVVHQFSPWFGVARPSRQAVKKFLGLSWWFMAWNLIMNLMLASDVVVLGLLNSVVSVTDYTLSKYAPETAITVVAMMVFGILPGLGGIIGSGDLERAAKIRGEIMTFTWLVVTVLGTGILLWNRTFIGMWVGENHFVGAIPDMLIVLVVLQFVLIRNDANVIDLTLLLSQKVILGAVSVSVSLLAACILVYFFKMGFIGVSVGIMIGRSILTVAYPKLIGKLLQVDLSTQIKAILRPTLVTGLLFLSVTTFESYLPTRGWHSVGGWLAFVLSAGFTACFALIIAFTCGLSRKQQKTILNRVRVLVKTSKE
jgi:O-antigen/teichoic acid export membrane protein